MLLNIARRCEIGGYANQYRSRQRLHSQTVLALLAGGIHGVAADRIIGDLLLLDMAVLLLGIALTTLCA